MPGKNKLNCIERHKSMRIIEVGDKVNNAITQKEERYQNYAYCNKVTVLLYFYIVAKDNSKNIC